MQNYEKNFTYANAFLSSVKQALSFGETLQFRSHSANPGVRMTGVFASLDRCLIERFECRTA